MIAGHEIAGSEIAGNYQDIKTPVVASASQYMEAFGLKPITFPGVGTALQTIEAFGPHIVMVAFCGVANQKTEAFGFTPTVSGIATPDLGIAIQKMEAFGAITDYLTEGEPKLVVSRSGTTVTVDVQNLENTPVSIWTAEGHRANFSFLNNYQTGDFPVTIEDVSSNLKVKAAFAVIAIRGGAESRTEGRRSPSKYTIES